MTTGPKVPTRKEYERVGREALDAMRRRRLWPKGSIAKCASCGKKAVVGRDDLHLDVPRMGVVMAFRNLQGGKCEACGAQFLEPAQAIELEDQIGVGTLSDYEAKVSKMGSGSLGTYWPRDVVRNMHLEPDTRAFIQVLDRDTAIVRFVHGPKSGDA